MNVYIVGDAGRTRPMDRLRCKDEARDIHDLIENNLDLIPGDQINPENPRQWLLVKREMPVPDPGSGSARWSIDFLLADQDAMPTFVECKRFNDTRCRREIVGQMLEYAANGHHYWSKDDLCAFAEETAQARGQTTEEALRSIQDTDEPEVAAYFERVEENLRQGQVRLVFALEDSPFELRSVVDFLNKQMERSEVLLVEIRQYASGPTRVAVPTLFGFTEEARRVKRAVAGEKATRRPWDRESFLAESASSLNPEGLDAVKSVLEAAENAGYEVSWGTGARTGSYSVKERSVCPRSLISVFSDGRLSFNFGWMDTSDEARRMGEQMAKLVGELLGIALPEGYSERFPAFGIEEWGDKSNEVANMLDILRADIAATDRA